MQLSFLHIRGDVRRIVSCPAKRLQCRRCSRKCSCLRTSWRRTASPSLNLIVEAAVRDAQRSSKGYLLQTTPTMTMYCAPQCKIWQAFRLSRCTPADQLGDSPSHVRPFEPSLRLHSVACIPVISVSDIQSHICWTTSKRAHYARTSSFACGSLAK
ncbi:hypothetical protein OH77DRAFT_1083478 [Trametes cingulata]|nr:hypothetical protein OH77DRAFT_1083478 [Trametes cingulata]